MRKYVAVPDSDDSGYELHIGDVENLELPDSAEVYEDENAFFDRIDELANPLTKPVVGWATFLTGLANRHTI